MRTSIQPLPPPAVYNHFKGKPEILTDVTDPTRHSMADLMIRFRALPASLERADVLVGGLVDLVKPGGTCRGSWPGSGPACGLAHRARRPAHRR